ncbi:MAG: hypothetical protein ABSD74_18530 [Rhizomicrobium sp.]|jgi:hypothetical protein
MAATYRATVEPKIVPQHTDGSIGELKSPWAQVARLAQLHDEAAETAFLANLLGRVPYLAAGLAAATAATAVLSRTELAPLLTWLTLVGAGTVALTRSYVTSIAAPFERASLQVFARDLQAILLYVGFAWGAGSFLALPADLTVFEVLLFSVGASALVAVFTREAEVAACFALPVIVLSALAAAIRPLDDAITATAAVLGAGLVLLAAIWALGRWAVLSPVADSLPSAPAD